MVERTETMLAQWRSGQELDVHEAMLQLTLRIVAETLFDAQLSDEVHEVADALEVVMGYFMDPMRWFRIREYLPTPATLRHRRAVWRLDKIIYGIIAQRRQCTNAPQDLLFRLMAAQDDHGRSMTDRQLRDEIVTIFLAGHETTALVLSYVFFLLSQHPQAEERLSMELDTVLAGRTPTPDDVTRLPYTGWVVREAMRLYPPAWVIGREAVSDCEIGGFSVPKGTQIHLVQWLVHRDPRWYDEPEAFRPQRWADDLERRLPRSAYFPFGDGPRICIGQHFAMLEAILILATVASRYRLTMPPGQSLTLLPSITLRPKSKIQMVLRPCR